MVLRLSQYKCRIHRIFFFFTSRAGQWSGVTLVTFLLGHLTFCNHPNHPDHPRHPDYQDHPDHPDHQYHPDLTVSLNASSHWEHLNGFSPWFILFSSIHSVPNSLSRFWQLKGLSFSCIFSWFYNAAFDEHSMTNFNSSNSWWFIRTESYLKDAKLTITSASGCLAAASLVDL